MQPASELRARHWQAARACALAACVLLLIGLEMPWFTVTGLRAEAPAPAVPFRHSFNAWQIAWPMALAVAAAALLSVYALLQRAHDGEHGWPRESIDIVWLCSFLVVTVAGVITFGLVDLPGVKSSACEAVPGAGPATLHRTDCLGGLVPPLTTHLDFAAVMSVALGLVLLGTAAWATHLATAAIEAEDAARG